MQSVKTLKKYNLVNLGTKYGGWTFVDEPDLAHSTIISAGLGEDASFDVAFAARYNARVIIVDPTPRAVEHFNRILPRIGMPPETRFGDTGTQDAKAYDLSQVENSQLQIVQKALWNEDTTIKFFAPKNKDHVSHSILNYQNQYAENTDHICVQATTITDLLADLHLIAEQVPLVKLDIEGAEIEVIESMISTGFLPHQILVEFDELNAPTRYGIRRIDKTHRMLRASGYRLIYSDGKADFLYYREL